MKNSEYLVAKREIRGIEVFNALCTGFFVLREHPELNQDRDRREDILLQAVMSILYDPDLYDANKKQAEERDKTAKALFGVMDLFKSEKEEDHE